MRFKQFLTELHMEPGQVDVFRLPPQLGGLSISKDEINRSFMMELGDLILTPEAGIQRIRKVLARYGEDMPALYDADNVGDEIVLPIGGLILYIIYCLDDDVRYDFSAELTDEEGLQEILSDEGEEEVH
jgi:hypothetical protein